MCSQLLRSTLLVAGLAFAGSASAAGEMASARMLSETCAGCHGTGGNSQGPATPGIAGLSKGYFIGAMMAFKYGDDEDKIMAAVAEFPKVVDPEIFEPFPRPATIMDRIAKGYTDAEIVAMSGYFADKKFIRHEQDVDPDLARRGADVHEDACEKCHEDSGTTSVDDVGLLAGQWAPYLRNTLMDFHKGDRAMPKKMRAKIKELSDADFEALVHYYAGYNK